MLFQYNWHAMSLKPSLANLAKIIFVLALANQKKLGKINHSFGAWRSLVAHLHGVQGVAGSNPAVPTILYTVLLFGVVRITRQPLVFLGIIRQDSV